MSHQHEQPVTRRAIAVLGVTWLVVLLGTTQCSRGSQRAASQPAATLRVGVGGVSVQANDAGLRQVVGNLSLEGLVNFNEDGRPRPFLAESWVASPDGLTLTFQLHKQAKFHDGSPVTALAVVGILREALPRAMGASYEDVADVQALDDSRLQFRLRRPAPLLIEALETTIQKPGKGGASVGPFVPTSNPLELRANLDYYQGRPALDSILFTPYPTVRAAWAELLRGGLDMLYEVNADSLDSLQSSTNVAVFSFVRHYQYMIIFGPGPAFQSAESETRTERRHRPGCARSRRPERPRAPLVRRRTAPPLGARPRRGQVHLQPEHCDAPARPALQVHVRRPRRLGLRARGPDREAPAGRGRCGHADHRNHAG